MSECHFFSVMYLSWLIPVIWFEVFFRCTISLNKRRASLSHVFLWSSLPYDTFDSNPVFDPRRFDQIPIFPSILSINIKKESGFCKLFSSFYCSGLEWNFCVSFLWLFAHRHTHTHTCSTSSPIGLFFQYNSTRSCFYQFYVFTDFKLYCLSHIDNASNMTGFLHLQAVTFLPFYAFTAVPPQKSP